MPAPSCSNRENMGFDFGMQSAETVYKLQFRWLFKIDGISAMADALPPLKGARPNFGFKEQMVSHIVEDIYYPVRPDWKPITLTLYDIKCNENPVFNWIKLLYKPQSGEWGNLAECNIDNQTQCFKRDAVLCLYDGCGEVIESWKYENAYPQTVNWGTLDMASSDVVTVDVTLRYDRAYLLTEESGP